MKNTRDFYNKTAMQWADKWYKDESMLPYLTEFFGYLPQNPKILDLCCGAGYESRRMQKLGATVTGLDFSQECIRIAKDKNPEIKFVVYDMLNDYSFLGKFDGCAVIGGLIHLQNEELETAFDMIDTVLYDKGFLFIAVRDGTGKDSKASYTSIDGEDYDRAFYLHSLDELRRYSLNKFEFVTEILPDENSPWKHYLFKKS